MDKTTLIGIITGAIFGTIFLVFVIVAVICFCKKRPDRVWFQVRQQQKIMIANIPAEQAHLRQLWGLPPQPPPILQPWGSPQQQPQVGQAWGLPQQQPQPGQLSFHSGSGLRAQAGLL